MSIIWMILIGFVVGLLARFVLPGRQSLGFILTTVLGIVGALLAGFLGRTMGWYADGEPAGLIASVIGAVLVLVVYGMVAKRT